MKRDGEKFIEAHIPGHDRLELATDDILKLDTIAYVVSKFNAGDNLDTIDIIDFLVENPKQLSLFKPEANKKKKGLVQIIAKKISGEDLIQIIDEIEKINKHIKNN